VCVPDLFIFSHGLIALFLGGLFSNYCGCALPPWDLTRPRCTVASPLLFFLPAGCSRAFLFPPSPNRSLPGQEHPTKEKGFFFFPPQQLRISPLPAHSRFSSVIKILCPEIPAPAPNSPCAPWPTPPPPKQVSCPFFSRFLTFSPPLIVLHSFVASPGLHSPRPKIPVRYPFHRPLPLTISRHAV